MPAWASRMAKSTATIKNMTIKIRSVVPDMAIPLVVRAGTSFTQGVAHCEVMQGSRHWGVWPK